MLFHMNICPSSCCTASKLCALHPVLFLQRVHNMEKKDLDAQVCVRVLAKKPGWKEANFQVNLEMYCM